MVLSQYGGPRHTDTNHQPQPSSSPPTTTGPTLGRLPLNQELVVVVVVGGVVVYLQPPGQIITLAVNHFTVRH